MDRAIRMLASLISGLVLVTVAPAACAQAPDWPYRSGFRESLLYVHPLVNYAAPPDRRDRWNAVRLGQGGLIGTFGSVSTDDLMVDARWSLAPELERGLCFRAAIDWQELRHLPRDRLDVELGFEATVWHDLGVVATATPAADKEEVDLQLGGVWASTDRARYVQVRYVLDDVVHDEKNDRGAVTRTAPRGLDWLLRLSSGAWTVASEGRWLREFDRVFPDPQRSDGELQHRFADNQLTVRLLRRFAASGALVEASFLLAEHAEARTYAAGAYDHDTSGWLRVLALRGLWPAAARWRLRGEVHRVDRRADGTGWRAFAYRREETIGAVFGQYCLGAHRVELGYVGTVFRWDDVSAEDGPASDHGYADKVMASLILGLARGSELQLSLSHEISDGDFGGASLQVLTVF